MNTLSGPAAPFSGKRFRLTAALCLTGLNLGACAGLGPRLAVSGTSAAQVELLPAVTKPAVAPDPTIMAPGPTTQGPKAANQRYARDRRAGGHAVIGAPYRVAGVWYRPAEQPGYDEVGVASWYGSEFHGRPTADGERFDMYATSAAHTTLPLPSIVEVTNLENGRSIRVRLNDRGPFKPGRIIDLSRSAAQQLGYLDKGLARVRVRYVGPAGQGDSLTPLYVARASRPEGGTLQLAAASTTRTPTTKTAKPARPPRQTAPAEMTLAEKYEAGIQRISLATNDRQAMPSFGGSKLAPLW
jgi:rare lipoprotein A (peptidoglycan hydrolase)